MMHRRIGVALAAAVVAFGLYWVVVAGVTVWQENHGHWGNFHHDQGWYFLASVIVAACAAAVGWMLYGRRHPSRR